MSRVCQVTGKKALVGNVSHSNRHTKRRFEVNLAQALLARGRGALDPAAASARAMRLIDKQGWPVVPQMRARGEKSDRAAGSAPPAAASERHTAARRAGLGLRWSQGGAAESRSARSKQDWLVVIGRRRSRQRARSPLRCRMAGTIAVGGFDGRLAAGPVSAGQRRRWRRLCARDHCCRRGGVGRRSRRLGRSGADRGSGRPRRSGRAGRHQRGPGPACRAAR